MGHNNTTGKATWTSTSCDGGDSFVVRSADGGTSNPPAFCGASTVETAYAVYCADTEVHCADCPANSVTSSRNPSGGPEECKPVGLQIVAPATIQSYGDFVRKKMRTQI